MSITYTIDIFCDGCSCWEHGDSGGYRLSVGQARDTAERASRLNGWMRVGNKDYCPTCRKKLELTTKGEYGLKVYIANFDSKSDDF